MADDYNLTVEELALIAPKQNVIGSAFKGSVSLGATIFFAEKIIEKIFNTRQVLPGKMGAYALLAGLVGGAAVGAVSAERYNKKLTHFTDRLKTNEEHIFSNGPCR